MKYWIYKESRILGPLDKEAMLGFPGLDSGTLVCPSDPDGGAWVPAGELSDLSGLSLTEYPKTRTAAVGTDEFPSEMGLLDCLQIDVAGLIGDDEFPGAFAEDLFQDADLKKSFGDILSARGPSDDLETLYRRIAELETIQTDLTRCIAEKDLELSRRGVSVAAAFAPTESLAPALPEIAILPTPEPSALHQTLSFDKPKSFKVVPTLKSFKVVAASQVVPAPLEPPVAVPEIVIQPVAIPTPEEATVVPMSAVATPAAVTFPTPVAVTFPTPAAIAFPTPVPPPPNTLSTDASVADLAVNDHPDVGRPDAGGATPPVPNAALARFAKPAPTTDAPKKPARNNKLFLIVSVVVVLLLLAVGLILMRQPKDDLKQMTNLDDGKAPIGVPNLNEGDTSASGPAKPSAAAPEPPGPAFATHKAAIATVKDFPLDGGRGTVGRWLQYSYTAGPDAGTEEWNASTTADKTVLVEYRLVPGPKGGNTALYLFELDVERGLVMGKNLEARQMLAGGPPSQAPKVKKRTAPKKAKRAAKGPVPESKEVPLLPLPDSGELRPPSEDDGAFDSDTINSGI